VRTEAMMAAKKDRRGTKENKYTPTGM